MLGCPAGTAGPDGTFGVRGTDNEFGFAEGLAFGGFWDGASEGDWAGEAGIELFTGVGADNAGVGEGVAAPPFAGLATCENALSTITGLSVKAILMKSARP